MKNFTVDKLVFSSIKLKLVIIYLALVFIVMLVSGTFMLASMRIEETNKSVDSLKLFTKNINENVIQTVSPENFQDALKNYPSKQLGYILNKEGKTIAYTGYIEDENTVSRPQFSNSAIISAIAGVSKYSFGKNADIGGQYKEWLNYAEPVKKESNGMEYIIFTRMETKDMNDRLLEIAKIFLLTIVMALVLTGILGFLFTNTLTVPIISLTKKAKEIAAGNLNQLIPVYSNDEIGQLTESFNFMSEELNQFMSTMASEKNKMEVILHNMTDGILAYDSDGVLIHANNASYDFLNEKIDELAFDAVMTILGCDVKSMKEIYEDLPSTQINVNDKYLSISFTSYKDKFGAVKGLVIVLQDITRLKKLDNMRKEFVANVSHEIRTPLTTIKSYTETLLDGALSDEGTAKEFLTVIGQEADRMTLLTQDLLELSRFDNQQLHLEFKRINITQILKQSIKQNVVIAKKKNQEIIFEDCNKDFWINGDGPRINQVFTNIINNAIKYSNDNTEISIRMEETDRYFRVFIRDNGIGIPKEDIHRIFERFYRVDKARSRAMGGTGLGLSIAKEIMEAHNGRIFATSEPGKGTTMILRFSKAEQAGE